jgi:hypothetical protein
LLRLPGVLLLLLLSGLLAALLLLLLLRMLLFLRCRLCILFVLFLRVGARAEKQKQSRRTCESCDRKSVHVVITTPLKEHVVRHWPIPALATKLPAFMPVNKEDR